MGVTKAMRCLANGVMVVVVVVVIVMSVDLGAEAKIRSVREKDGVKWIYKLRTQRKGETDYTTKNSLRFHNS